MLEIYLFGRVRVRHSPDPKETLLTGTLGDLLTFLVLHRHRLVERDVLVDMFWREEDPKHGHRCLSTALWRLRQVLEPPSVPRGTFLTCPSFCDAGFDGASDFRLDTLGFEACARPSLARPPHDLQLADIQELEEAISMYQADLAESCQFPWVLGERERLRTLYLSCQEHLMKYYASHELHERSIEFGQHILEDDPFREEVHQQVIRSYLAIGQRSLAVRQYLRCQQALAVYLNSEPMDETKELLHQSEGLWNKAEGLSRETSGLHDNAVELEVAAVCEQLVIAVSTLREVEQRVDAAMHRLDVITLTGATLSSAPWPVVISR